jgi:hypothetical protein
LRGKRRYLVLIFVLFLSFTIAEANIEATYNYVIHSKECSTCPTIDGVLSSGEWGGAEAQQFTLQSADESESYPVTLQAMNDGINMYFAVTVSDDDYNRFDKFTIRLKDPESGFFDFLYAQADGFSYDGYFKDPMMVRDKTDSGTDDINASVKYESKVYVFEFSRTLDSVDDTHDIGLSPGGYMELKVNYGDSDKGNVAGVAWPPKEWAVVVLAEAEAPDIPQKTETPPPRTGAKGNLCRHSGELEILHERL